MGAYLPNCNISIEKNITKTKLVYTVCRPTYMESLKRDEIINVVPRILTASTCQEQMAKKEFQEFKSSANLASSVNLNKKLTQINANNLL